MRGQGRFRAMGGVFFTGALWVPKLLGHQKPVGSDALACVVMPPPASAFVVPEPQFLLGVLLVALDAPAHLGFEDHALQ